jgi:hypothetical protein
MYGEGAELNKFVKDNLRMIFKDKTFDVVNRYNDYMDIIYDNDELEFFHLNKRQSGCADPEGHDLCSCYAVILYPKSEKEQISLCVSLVCFNDDDY